MRRAVLAILLAGCGGDSSGPQMQILALAGEVPVEAGANVVSHSADGTIVDSTTTDGAGRASLAIADYVSIVYVRSAGSYVMTTVPLTDATLAIHGPPPDAAPIIAGAVEITADPLDGPFTIELGCNTVTAAALPTTINILATCFGSDTNIDVLVHAADSYFAARVPIVDEVGMLDISPWQTTPVDIAVANTTAATIDVTEIADGFAYPALGTTTWAGLVADTTQITGTLPGRTTTQFLAGVATTAAFSDDDFLPAPTSAITHTTTSFTWSPLAGGDLIDVHADHWDAVLPADAAQISFPALSISAPTSVTVRAIDGPDTSDFASAQAAGIWYPTIVPPVSTGEVKIAAVRSM